MVSWSPQQYLQFSDERTRAARDLLAQVPLAKAQCIFDLGCGPGNSTALLADAYPGARLVGLDNSPEMLARARQSLPAGQFVEADLRDWAAPSEADLLFSNATFQWVPGHVAVLQRLLRGLKSGAVVAVQMPDNLGEPSHMAMVEAGQGQPYADKLGPAAAVREALPGAAAYYDALQPLSSRVEIWHSVYNHVLTGPGGIVEWMKGTGLRPFLEVLDEDERADFLRRYEALLAKAYPKQGDGKVLLRFPRLFIVATRSTGN